MMLDFDKIASASLRRLGRARKVESKSELLLVDFDENTRRLCTRIVESLDCRVLLATDEQSVLRILQSEEVGAAVIDAATILDYLDLTKTIKKTFPRVEVVIADEQAKVPRAIAAIKAGAADYLEKPLDETILETAISQALYAYRNFEASVIPLDKLEKQAIEDAIAQAKGDKIEAARLLSIGKTTLYRKLREYGGRTEPRLRRSGTE